MMIVALMYGFSPSPTIDMRQEVAAREERQQAEEVVAAARVALGEQLRVDARDQHVRQGTVDRSG